MLSQKKKFDKFLFGPRFKKLLETVDEKDLAKSLGLTSTSAFRQWTNGYSLPTCENLFRISEYFKVSADYLLGRTDIKSSDITIREIGDKTGLRDEAINTLIKLRNVVYGKNSSLPESEIDQLVLISRLLESPRVLEEITSSAALYYKFKRETQKMALVELSEREMSDFLNYAYDKFGFSFAFTTGEESVDLMLFSCQQAFINFIKNLGSAEPS